MLSCINAIKNSHLEKIIIAIIVFKNENFGKVYKWNTQKIV